MNIQHSSRTDEWYTPINILDRVKMVLGTIDLDPASCAEANDRVGARQYYTEQENALDQAWSAKTIFCNPPGGKTGNKSNTVLFWDKMMRYKHNAAFRQFEHGIFLAFSLEALQTTQQCEYPILGNPICIPRKRISFVHPDGTPGSAPSHSNVIVYVSGSVDKSHLFRTIFSDLGVCT